MRLQAWLLTEELGFLSVSLVLALLEGCSLASSCFSFSEKLPIKIDLPAAWPARKKRRRGALGCKLYGDIVSVVFSSTDLLLRINWSKYISREGEEEDL